MRAKISIFFFAVLCVASCYVDNGEELYNCASTPASVAYSSVIKSILSANGCTGCHSGAQPSGGHNLSVYDGVKARVDDGKLWGAVNHLPGFVPMPQGGSKISECDIKRLKVWIDAGAPNN